MGFGLVSSILTARNTAAYRPLTELKLNRQIEAYGPSMPSLHQDLPTEPQG